MLACMVTNGYLNAAELGSRLTIGWQDNWLNIRGGHLPRGEMRVHYLEAYCRPGSTDRDWDETVIGHRTDLVSSDEDGHGLKLRCTLMDGATVEHEITARRVDPLTDAIDCRLIARNPTDKTSQAHWAQPCIRVDQFTGRGKEDYLSRCFIYLDDKSTRLPTQPWAERARYVPGQVYCPAHVDRNDVNPRPLSSRVPSNGLIGCFSDDGRQIMAAAWEPYQELFQGVGVCIHSDFRIGGLKPGETKKIRGTMYFTTAGADAVLERYQSEFPEHGAGSGKRNSEDPEKAPSR